MSDEGEDIPLRPRRRIKRVTVLSSSSDSESDDSVVAATTRRKRMRVVSDEDSESSGSSVVRAGMRRTRALPQLNDSDGASDGSETTARASVPSATARHNASSGAAGRPSSGFGSDSSEGNSEKCSICLLRFTDQEVGTPETCEHIFCLDCITEWSRNVNTCPVDRITFNSIVVRACAGGRVLRSEPVVVIERRPSVEMLVIEDAETECEICGRSDDEDTMLLCDGCEQGYHMMCLTPPLQQVPIEQWLCPNCHDLLEMNLSDVDELSIGDIDEYMNLHAESLPALVQQARSAAALARGLAAAQPSTSAGPSAAPSASRAPRAPPHTSRAARAPRAPRAARAPRTHRAARSSARRKPGRTTRTVIIEYEEAGHGSQPVLKRIKRRVKKKKTRKRQPRTAARRTHVRQSVRAKLASMRLDQRQELSGLSTASSGVQDLSVRRHRAGIPSLSILGNPNQLDYFSEDEEQDVSQGANLGVAVRPTSHVLNTFRQARRKMITVSSPPHASSAPDILSSILENQTLLHAKNSVVSISVDGNVNIKIKSTDRKLTHKPSEVKKDDSRVDVSKGEDSARKVPSYPGQSRGGGWGGGYRGNYHREQGTTGFGRGSYNDGNYGGGYQSRQRNSYQNNTTRRDDNDTYNNYSRRPNQYPQADDLAFERNRRHSDVGRGPNPHPRHNEHARYGPGAAPAWQPYSAAPRPDPPATHHRHSFGGFENPLDMRTGHIPQHASAPKPTDGYATNDAHRRDNRSQTYRPLPEPPVFKYDNTADMEKSEDEKSDSSLVIDTDKYDPTEPTKDDDSGDEDSARSVGAPPALPAPPAPPAAAAPPAEPEPAPEAAPPPAPPAAAPPAPLDVRSALASLDASGLGVSPSVLDSAVRQVLKEHRGLLAPARASDDDSDGDCPNFSIYSATSVHIANSTSVLATPDTPDQQLHDNLEDLVQEDDVPTPEPEEPESETDLEPEPKHEPTPAAKDVDAPSAKTVEVPAPSSKYTAAESKIKKRSEEEYKEKVSKRCPITTNTRNPIKIKLNTPSLMKRHVSLYDEEEALVADDAAPSEREPEHEPAADTGLRHSPGERGSDEPACDITQKNYGEKESKVSNKERSPIIERDHDMTPEPRESNERCQQSDDSEHAPPAETGSTNHTDHVGNDKGSDFETECKDKLAESKGNDLKSDDDVNSEEEASESEAPERASSLSLNKVSAERNDDALEKMTESISETEDERSYTPCLDENKSKDTSLETDKDKGIEGLDTEMISEEEGNEMFSEEERTRSETRRASPPPRVAPEPAPAPEPEPIDAKKDTKTDVDTKKRKKKESKKDVKDRTKGKRKAEVAFRKLSKSGKERNYRERDKDGAAERRDSTDSAEREKRKRKRKEKRKDLERYDVRTVVSEKRRKRKDAFGRDVSPRMRSRSGSPSLSRSPPPRRSVSRPRRSPSRARASPPRRPASRPRRTASRLRGSPSPARRRRTATPRGSPSPPSPRAASPRRRRRSPDRAKRAEPRRRRSADRARKRRRSASASKSPRPKSTKRKKRARSERPASRRRSPRRKSPRRRRARRRSASRGPDASPARAPPAPSEPAGWSPGSADSRLQSPRTPPPAPPPEDAPARRRRDPERARHRRARDAGGASKEVFTSGDNILVSVSFKEQEVDDEDERRERRRERRRRRRRPAAPEPDTGAVRPVAIIDLERSPFRELTPSPRNVIVLSDSEPGERGESGPAPEAAAPEPVGPKTPPEPAAPETAPEPAPEESRGPNTPPEPPDSPDAYDPYEPTRSASASPSPEMAASPPRTTITLETAQKTNMSADEVLDRRPISPIEKVMALLQSTREVSPEPPPDPPAAAEAAPPAAAAPAPSASAAAAAPPAAPAPAPAGPPVRIVLPEPTRAAPPKLFLAKPSPIKSDPIKPMQAAKLPRPAPADSPYSPGSSDFGELFEPPPGAERARRGRHRGKGKMQVGVKIDDENLKILDDLPSSAVEMQVKSKFLKKLNRQERVVEEVKLVLKPHYNKKHVTKDEYKDILRRAVPKICHNKSGEINPTKIQALIEAYVKKIRKKHKLGLV